MRRRSPEQQLPATSSGASIHGDTQQQNGRIEQATPQNDAAEPGGATGTANARHEPWAGAAATAISAAAGDDAPAADGLRSADAAACAAHDADAANAANVSAADADARTDASAMARGLPAATVLTARGRE